MTISCFKLSEIALKFWMFWAVKFLGEGIPKFVTKCYELLVSTEHVTGKVWCRWVVS